jgi:hypothetical protein
MDADIKASYGPPQNPDRRISAGDPDQQAGSFKIRPRLPTGLHHTPEITSGFLFDEVVSRTAADGTEDSIC